MAAVSQKRIALLDEIRGFCLVCMVFYHAYYLFGSMGGIDFFSTIYRLFEPVQLLFASAFICISGICTNFSRSPLRRGLMLLGIAVCVSVVTVFLLPKIGLDRFQDKFGILHLLALCMILAGLLRRLPRKPAPLPSAIIFAVLYALSALLLSGRIPLPDALLQNPYLFPLGLHNAEFYSADYFPLLPHMFVFLIGVQIGRILCEKELPSSAFCVHVRPFAFIGRHSLVVYLAHVPCLLAILYILERI